MPSQPKPEARAASANSVLSVATGARLLGAFARYDGPVTLSQLANDAAMPLSKAHRYLAGYINAGLVRQDADSRYALGTLALEIGLAALRQIDIVEVATEDTLSLQRRVGQAVGLTVWSREGPMVVRHLPGSQSITLNAKLGVVLPVTASANGFVFAAFAETPEVTRCIDIETERAARTAAERKRYLAAFHAKIADTRAHGYGVLDGDQAAGVVCIAAPIYHYERQLAGAVSIIGIRSILDVSRSGKPVQFLCDAAARISQRLGLRT